MDKEWTILWLFIKITSKASKKLWFWVVMKKTLFPSVFPYHSTHRKRDKECKLLRTTYGFSRTSPQIDPRATANIWIQVWILSKHWTVGIHAMHREGKTHLVMWAMNANSELHIKYKLNKNTRSNFCLLFSAQQQTQIKAAETILWRFVITDLIYFYFSTGYGFLLGKWSPHLHISLLYNFLYSSFYTSSKFMGLAGACILKLDGGSP